MLDRFLIATADGPGYEGNIKLAIEVKTFLGTNNKIAHLSGEIDVPNTHPDMVIAIGGDGTIMRAMKKYSQYDIPTFGINGGRLGFLAGAERDNWQDALKRILADKYVIEERLALQFRFGNQVIGPVVNEVKVEHPTEVMFYQVQINNLVFWHALEAYGVFVGTATGSNAEHFSSHGQPIFPTSNDVSLTPKRRQGVGFDPFHFPEVSRGGSVTITPLGGAHGATEVPVIADGMKYENDGALLQVGESIVITRAEKPMLLTTFGLEQFFSALEEKKGYPLSRNKCST